MLDVKVERLAIDVDEEFGLERVVSHKTVDGHCRYDEPLVDILYRGGEQQLFKFLHVALLEHQTGEHILEHLLPVFFLFLANHLQSLLHDLRVALQLHDSDV